VAGSAIYQTWSRSREYHFAGISCSRVIALAQDYAAGKLDDAQHEQVRRHVSLCPHCKPLFQKMGIVVQARPPQNASGALPKSSTVIGRLGTPSSASIRTSLASWQSRPIQSPGEYFLPPPLSAFHHEYPRVRVRATSSKIGWVMWDVTKGQAG
jgi:hypothetical protein